MRYYFLMAKIVGLTGVFLARIWTTSGSADGALPTLFSRSAQAGWLCAGARTDCAPQRRLLSAGSGPPAGDFSLSDKHGLDITPAQMIAARRDALLIDHAVRKDPRANAFFMDVLTSPRDPESVLRTMNQKRQYSAVLYRFRSRGRARCSSIAYHHYTVDEHTIRAVGLGGANRERSAQGRSSTFDRPASASSSPAVCCMSQC